MNARQTLPDQARSPWPWAWSGAAVGLMAGVALFAPARWVAAAVDQGSNHQIQLRNVRGTVWEGSAQLMFSGGTGSQDAVELPGTLHWRLTPQWSHLALQVRSDCCTPQPVAMQLAPLGWGGARLSVGDHQSQWPASLLSGLGTPWNTVQAAGQLTVSSKDFSSQWVQGRSQMAGSIQLDATDISSRLSTLQPMGSYRVTLQGDNGVQLRLETLEGSLQLSGQGQWVGDRLRFEGEARAQADRVEALSNLLNIIGRREGARSIIKVG